MKKLVLAALGTIVLASPTFGAGWGTVKGTVVVKGKAPAPVLLHKKGAALKKDAEVCAAEDLFKDDVVIDEETGGLANVFIYMARAPKTIHPDLKDAPAEPVVFGQKNCQFVPHAVVVRVGQSVEVTSDDPIAHNTHTHPLRNNGVNILIPPNTTAGNGVKVDHKAAERLPTKVTCDLHDFMEARWMIIDHPYATVTNAKGEFTIENLPDGKHEFIVYHEKALYIDKKLEVTVKAGEVSEVKPIEVDASKL
ncbi:MAG: hypothetical protein KDA85_11230 [Planctomycetaceae bacterium]|nr:hypothetical protein [Planctomycetaceae bacterium]